MNHSANTSVHTTHVNARLAAYMHGAYFLTGVGVLMLGPLLPLFQQEWHLADGQGGLLLTCQFLGSYTGAVLLQSNLQKSLTVGSICLAVGYATLCVAAAHPYGFLMGIVALLVGGFGIGQLVNSVSLIAGRHYARRRASALMSLNLVWSAGALLAPLLIGFAKNRLSLSTLILIFACSATLLALSQFALPERLALNEHQGSPSDNIISLPAQHDIATSLLGYFALLFFLYGALENSVSGWIATFSIRYTHISTAMGAYSTTMLWVGITAGRALALLLLRRFSERSIQIGGVILTILAAAALRLVNDIGALLVLAVVLGASLSSFIPVTSSLFLGRVRAKPRQAGFVMATSALGGAVLPFLIGVASQQAGSLKLALKLPVAVGVVLLVFCIWPLASAKKTESFEYRTET